MSPAAFDALATLLRLRAGPARDAVELVMVQGLSVPDAAREAGLEYRFAWRAVKRAEEGLALARRASELKD